MTAATWMVVQPKAGAYRLPGVDELGAQPEVSHETGMLAVRTVLRLLDDEPLESAEDELATEVVVRDSPAPPGGGTHRHA